MFRFFVVAGVTVTAGCGLFPDLGGLAGEDASATDATTIDSGPDATADSANDSSGDAGDSGPDAPSCTTCNSMVSVYRFADPNNLGHDSIGPNHMMTVHGAPTQSTVTPIGFGGYSIQLDGSSCVCIDSGYSFDSTSDHTLCFWSQPAALADSTNQFAQACGYDTWTANSGADYLWRINNCNGGTPIDLQVSNVYSVGKWVQICQTYVKSTLTRTVMIDGQTNVKHVNVDTAPIVESTSSNWCIGAYGSGGFWTGRIYLPMWFNRVLSDSEIQTVYSGSCCLP